MAEVEEVLFTCDGYGSSSTFMHRLARNGTSETVLPVLRVLPQHLILRLLSAGDAYGKTALHVASENLNDHMVVVLINYALTQFTNTGMRTILCDINFHQ